MTSAPKVIFDSSAAPRPASFLQFRRTPAAKAPRQGGNAILPIAALLSLFPICASVAPQIGGEVVQGVKTPLSKTNLRTTAPLEWMPGVAVQSFNIRTSTPETADPPSQKERLPKRDY